MPFTLSNSFSASTTALAKKLMKPRPTLCFFSNVSLYFARIAITFERSTSLNVVRMAAVCWACDEPFGDLLADLAHRHASDRTVGTLHRRCDDRRGFGGFGIDRRAQCARDHRPRDWLISRWLFRVLP